ncbi:MAG: winged helix-turn-helix domain-containing protein [Cyanobacteriota bacterium]|jgi:DNA-binding winged helix-turn-helix (wHTH) protein
MDSVTSWQVGPYVLSSDGILRLGGGVITLSPLQRKLLLCFVRHSGKLIERSQLVEEVWGHSKVSDVSIARAVHSLRQVLDQGPLGSRVITTTYGSGYVFAAHVVTIEEAPQVVVSEISTPSPLALEYYLEARVASRHLDPAQLERSRKLLQLALQTSPSFCEAILFLISLHLNCCRWGLQDSQSTGAMIEPLLNRAEHLNAPAEDLLPLRAEVISLLHWQPKLVDESFGSWLPHQLGYGLPLLSWVRHLMASGRAREGLTLLEPHLDGALPMGWLLAAQLTFQLGQTEAAIEMLEAQRRMDGSLPATHLFLALLHAHRGERSAALQSLAAIGASSQGLQAVLAYVLARVGDTARAESLLYQAKAGGSAASGLASFWGLSAVVQGQPALADHFFQLAVQRRCYQAPFLAQSQLLAPYTSEPSVKCFQKQMVRFFPSLLSQPSAASKQVGAPARP